MSDDTPPNDPPPTPPTDPPAEPPKEPPKEPPADPPPPADAPAEKSQVDIAKELVGEMKKQNEIMTANLKKAEALSAEQLLGGHTPAGVEKTKEDLEVDAARKLLAGTGYEDMLFPPKK